MKTETVQVGQLVRSAAGRDKGKFYLIFDVLDEAFVRVIDGEKKQVTNPKRKNVKHLGIFPERAEEIAGKLSRGESVPGDEVAGAIRILGLSHKS